MLTLAAPGLVGKMPMSLLASAWELHGVVGCGDLAYWPRANWQNACVPLSHGVVGSTAGLRRRCGGLRQGEGELALIGPSWQRGLTD